MQELIESAVEFILPTAIGLALILLGRRLFWALGGLAFAALALVISAAIFVPAALEIATSASGVQIEVAEQQAPEVFLIATVVGGLLGVVFTLRFPKAAGAVVGFSCGALFFLFTLELFNIQLPEPVRRSLVIIVGTIVAFIALRQPQEAMIILSTILGSQLIVGITQLDLNSPLSAYVWLISMLVGLVYQTSVWRTEQRKQTENPPVAKSEAMLWNK